MCLVAIAHRTSTRFPLVIAANRDEDYDRPTHDAHFWSDAPEVLGGRDAVAQGSWLAVTRGGRFAAVTNLRDAERKSRSRGALVRDFVSGDATPATFVDSVVPRLDEYSGFHLFAGEAGGEAIYLSPAARRPLEPGIHAVSNAPHGEHWPKQELAMQEMEIALRMPDAETAVLVLLQFLATPRGTGELASEVFIKGERYGTRASTVVVATPSEIVFAEQSFTRGGEPYGKNRLFRIELG